MNIPVSGSEAVKFGKQLPYSPRDPYASWHVSNLLEKHPTLAEQGLAESRKCPSSLEQPERKTKS